MRAMQPSSPGRIGAFRISLRSRNAVPWCTYPGVPAVIIESLRTVRDVCGAKLYAFCVLPTRFHAVLDPGASGLRHVIQTFRTHGTGELLTPPLCSGWEDFCCDELLPDLERWARAMYDVEHGAVLQGLVSDVAEWPWTSLHYQETVDRMEGALSDAAVGG